MADLYWWSLIYKGGKLNVLGPFSSEEAAIDKSEKFNGDNYEVLQLPTRNMARAGSMIKAKTNRTKRISKYNPQPPEGEYLSRIPL